LVEVIVAEDPWEREFWDAVNYNEQRTIFYNAMRISYEEIERYRKWGTFRMQYVYIAAPFFNDPQTEIVSRIEDLCGRHGLRYYSPRLHSGSGGLTPAEKKDPASWKPVLESNIQALHECTLLIAVIEYALNDISDKLGIWNPGDEQEAPSLIEIPEIPDTGVVFECGYVYALNHTAYGTAHPTAIIGFHTTKQPEKLNLMLSHTLDGYVQGYDNLGRFLGNPKLYLENMDLFTKSVEAI
jgi:nucleoside 2-deoxyribosyltransferase